MLLPKGEGTEPQCPKGKPGLREHEGTGSERGVWGRGGSRGLPCFGSAKLQGALPVALALDLARILKK